jgi:hypothetical protein
MATIYFNSEFVGPNVPYAEKFRGLCFRPLHYFFEGQTRLFYRRSFDSNLSYPADQKNWPTSLKMAILIVPGLIVGTIAAVVSMVEWFFCYQLHDFRPALNHAWIEQHEKPIYVKQDQETPFVAPTYALTDDFSPNKSHAELDKMMVANSKKAGTLGWENSEFRAELDRVMTEAHKEMHLIFKHAAKAANNDPTQMANLMAAQHNSDPDGENYCRAFFYGSIGQVYYAISANNTKPSFTPGTLEYRWRRLHNDACALIDQYPGLREALKKRDNRFLTCAIPHLYPSSAPSAWDDCPTLKPIPLAP